MIASHLNGKQFDRVKEYARHLAGQFGRIGLIELDGSEFRLSCFEPGAPAYFQADLSDAGDAFARVSAVPVLGSRSAAVGRWWSVRVMVSFRRYPTRIPRRAGPSHPFPPWAHARRPGRWRGAHVPAEPVAFPR